MVNHVCNTCLKQFKRRIDLIYHLEHKKIPCRPNIINNPPENLQKTPNTSNQLKTDIKDKIITYSCPHCKQFFKRKDILKRHIDYRCKVKILDIEKDKDIIDIKKNLEEIKKNMNVFNNNIEKNIELDNKIVSIMKTNEIREINNNISILENKEYLIINDITIQNRINDNYINATQLCKAGNKNFNDWYILESTKQLINELEKTIIISNEEFAILGNNIHNFFIDKNNQDIWIHPDLAIQLAQWISPVFAIQISKWIRDTISKKEFELNKKVKTLENLYVKKQKRKDYPEKYVIYILTTESNKKDNIYIIGKAKTLKTRLGTYNKTCEHEVIYYKTCGDEDSMDLAEKIVLHKLEKCREVANRDRFKLPIDKDIEFFINTINKSISALVD